MKNFSEILQFLPRLTIIRASFARFLFVEYLSFTIYVLILIKRGENTMKIVN